MGQNPPRCLPLTCHAPLAPAKARAAVEALLRGVRGAKQHAVERELYGRAEELKRQEEEKADVVLWRGSVENRCKDSRKSNSSLI